MNCAGKKESLSALNLPHRCRSHFNKKIISEIKQRIRDNASTRHMPAKIIQVADIPRTINGKITEIAVRDIIHGREVGNKDALISPESLELFKNIPELNE